MMIQIITPKTYVESNVAARRLENAFWIERAPKKCVTLWSSKTLSEAYISNRLWTDDALVLGFGRYIAKNVHVALLQFKSSQQIFMSNQLWERKNTKGMVMIISVWFHDNSNQLPKHICRISRGRTTPWKCRSAFGNEKAAEKWSRSYNGDPITIQIIIRST